MGKKRAACCDNSQVKRGPWSDEESEKLRDFILKNGHQNWRSIPKLAGLMRCGKSCRLRWINYLKPGLKRGNLTKEDEDTIIQLHQAHGNKWSKIASHFPGRTDNEIKNVWNTRLKKRLTNNNSSSSSSISDATNHHASSPSSSSTSLVSNEVIKGEKLNQEVKVEEILGEDMASGFEVNALQSLEFLFEDHQITPARPISKPVSQAIFREPDNEFCTRMAEPELDDFNEWLNYLDNQTFWNTQL